MAVNYGDLEPYDHPPKVVVFCNCLKHPIPDNSTPDKKQLAFISAILNTSPVTKSLGITIFSAARVSSKTTLPGVAAIGRRPFTQVGEGRRASDPGLLVLLGVIVLTAGLVVIAGIAATSEVAVSAVAAVSAEVFLVVVTEDVGETSVSIVDSVAENVPFFLIKEL